MKILRISEYLLLKEEEKEEYLNSLDHSSYIKFLDQVEKEYETYSEEEPTSSFLEGIKGSLGIERQNSKPKNYNRFIKEFRALNKKSRPYLELSFISKNPEQFNIWLSQLLEAYPKVNLSFRLRNFEKKVDTNKKLRSFLIFFILKERAWYDIYISEKIENFLKRKQFQSKTFRECYALWKISTFLSKEQFLEIINETYQKSTLEIWEKTGKSLFSDLNFQLLETSIIKEKVYRRGYARSNKRTRSKLKDQDRKARYIELPGTSDLNKINFTFELFIPKKKGETSMEDLELKARILKKQMILFEQELDKILELKDQELSKSQKARILRNSFSPSSPEELEKVTEESILRNI